MEHISKHLPLNSNSKTLSQKQNNTLEAFKGSDWELTFAQLWLKLEATYVQQGFNKTMGKINSPTARAWRVEFSNNAITPNEIIFMRDNLILLKSPEFIPNSLTMVKLCRDPSEKEDCRTSLGNAINPDSLPDKKEIINKRKETASIRGDCMELINEMLHRKDSDEERPVSHINKIAPGPTDRMVRLVHNHNVLLISQGYAPLSYPQCKKRAFELGLM